MTPITFKATVILSPKILQNKFNVLLNGNNFVKFKNLTVKEYERYNHLNCISTDKEIANDTFNSSNDLH